MFPQRPGGNQNLSGEGNGDPADRKARQLFAASGPNLPLDRRQIAIHDGNAERQTREIRTIPQSAVSGAQKKTSAVAANAPDSRLPKPVGPRIAMRSRSARRYRVVPRNLVNLLLGGDVEVITLQGKWPMLPASQLEAAQSVQTRHVSAIDSALTTCTAAIHPGWLRIAMVLSTASPRTASMPRLSESWYGFRFRSFNPLAPCEPAGT